MRNPLKRKNLGGFILVKRNLEKSKSKIKNALAILKLWEEDLKIMDEINEKKVKPKANNDCPNISDSKYKKAKVMCEKLYAAI